MAPKVAIVFYSLYGHIMKMAEAEAEGLKKAGVEVDFYQIPETLPQEILNILHAPPRTDKYPDLDGPATLEKYDGILLGIPTRFGNFPSQWKSFWDGTGAQWMGAKYYGKFAGMFVSTSSPGGGQESTCFSVMSTLVHHGFTYVPLGYGPQQVGLLTNLKEVHGGSPWGAGTYSDGDGSRWPTELELKVASIQGEEFGKKLIKAGF